MSGMQPVDEHGPVAHVSYYEADAYARWRGKHLPTEQEWEHAAEGEPIRGNLLASGLYHPVPAAGNGQRLQQLFGDLWEWTQSAYAPYPGFRPLEGSLGEYNGKFMVNQMVLRGGPVRLPGRTSGRPTATSSLPTPDGSSPASAWRTTPEAAKSPALMTQTPAMLEVGPRPQSAYGTLPGQSRRNPIEVYVNGASTPESVSQDIRRGLTGHPKSLPPKFFYDARGSALFDRITRLPERVPSEAPPIVLLSRTHS